MGAEVLMTSIGGGVTLADLHAAAIFACFMQAPEGVSLLKRVRKIDLLMATIRRSPQYVPNNAVSSRVRHATANFEPSAQTLRLFN
jgi:hypothetical protein